jgi:hypothetical protein
MDERRFLVLDVAPTHQQDHAYFAAILAELDQGGRAAFLYDLLHDNLSAFNLRNVPSTEGLREQKVLSLQPNQRWLFDKLMAGRWLSTHDGWVTLVSKEAVHDDYVLSLQRAGVERRGTQTELGMFIGKILPDAKTVRRTLDGRRCWCWTLPTLQASRMAFDAATSSAHPWNEEDDDAEVG